MSELFSEFETILKEASATVEKDLALEGWTKLGTSSMSDLNGSARTDYTKKSRYLYNFDPLAKQAIRLWTDYAFGNGISWQSEDDKVQEALNKFWNNPANRSVLSAKGQRKSSDKALVDGEVFFALFLGPDGEVTIRWIDPLEITEIITDPDDIETIMFYKREWTDTQGTAHTSYYRSHTNIKDESSSDSMKKAVKSTEDAIVYHLAINTIGQRGNPLLLPVIGWIEQYRLFLAARIAIVRALARFAWIAKTKGGASAVATVKAATEGKLPQAGSTAVTNEAVSLDPIKTDTGSANANTDGRMLKNQICVGVGVLPHYMGDLETSNLATAKSVELPMLKMFASYQQVWSDVIWDIFNIVLNHNGISPDDRFIDIDFPEIVPADAVSALTAIQSLISAFPNMVDSNEIMKQALINIGLNNVDEILSNLEELQKEKEPNAQPPMPPNASPDDNQDQSTPDVPPTKESAEIRAIKALQEIRKGIEDVSTK